MDKIREMLEITKSIAVIGMKELEYEEAYKIPLYMKEHGYDIYPVNPTKRGIEVWGKEFYEKLSDIETPVDMVNIFRRPEFLVGHAKEILALSTLPKYVWFQLGIYNDEAAKMLEAKGISVVQNRCIMVEHTRLFH
jgi:predicted CoA-binding protein